MKTINIKAGEKTRIIRKFSNSLATEYKFLVEPAKTGTPVSGQIEISRSYWIFPKASETQELRQNNTVTKGMWDTFYSVFVTPKHDVTVSLEGGSFNSRFFYLIAGIVFLAILSSLIPFLLR